MDIICSANIIILKSPNSDFLITFQVFLSKQNGNFLLGALFVLHLLRDDGVDKKFEYDTLK